jgi:hypothetical protein
MVYRFCAYVLIAYLSSISLQVALAGELTETITSGKAYGDFNLRYESVDQENDLKNAKALTLRSRLGYRTGDYAGFSGLIEFEDSRVAGGIDDYNDGLGSQPEYSVIADPETTELDQGYLQYKVSGSTSRLGRQVITHDNHRFVGHVGWRQDRQTFDAFVISHESAEGPALSYNYIDKRNRIFAEERDVDSKDHLFNVAFDNALGKLTGYAYLLEEDNVSELSFDTYGVRFSGASPAGDFKVHYTVEYATQEKSEVGTPDFEADYYKLKGGLEFATVTASLGYEVLGSDSGEYGFSTPLATLHKFNGWADQFLSTPNEGLQDFSVSLSGNLVGGTWVLAIHDFKADKGTGSVDDLGEEIDFSYARSFYRHFSAGIKFADYSAGDIKVDTSKYWFWVSARF